MTYDGDKARYVVDILILGSGFAGLGTAVEAQRLGLDSLVLESEATAGGLARGISISGFHFDRFGPKIIIEREASQDLVELLDVNVRPHVLYEQVYLSGRGLYSFPIQRHLVELDPVERAKILQDVFSSEGSLDGHEPASYEEWLLASFGRRLCELVLFPYEEKK